MKKKTILIVSIILTLFLVVLIIYKTAHKKEINPKITVKNGLSINYLDGDELYASTKKKTYTFSVTNDSELDKYYQIDIENISKPEGVNIEIKCEETNTDRKITDLSIGSLIDYAVITPGETHTYELSISPILSDVKIGNININEYTFSNEYFAQTIISNSTIYQNPQTSVGNEISINDEGLIQDIDDDGQTYYFRGAATNNYFKFADQMWRIVRINGNNTVKVILDGATDSLSTYYDEVSNNFYKFNGSNIKKYLDLWYSENLQQYDKYIASSKACDYTLFTGSDEYIFEASQRLEINHVPTFNCLGNKVNTKIMLLTADEVEYAGGLIGISNTNYYLYNSNILNPSWTITPAKGNASEYYPYVLGITGQIESTSLGNQTRAVRPVININKKVTVTGKGTYDNPYQISE